MKARAEWVALIVAATAGAALWLVTGVGTGKREPWDDPAYWTAVYPLTLGVCGALGLLWPRRPWRWALTVSLAQFVAMIARGGEVGSLAPLGFIALVVLSVPGALIAHLAAWSRRTLAK